LLNAWIAPLKGIWDLLDAVRHLSPSHPKLEVACIGEGDSEIEWRSAIEKAGLSARFRLLGRRKASEVSQWLAASDLLCLPSHTEGCPNAVVEALSCGRPVVATNVGGIPELVSPEAAILVPPRSPQDLAEALKLGLTRQWDEQAIAKKSRRSWEQVAQETFDVCASVTTAVKV
jgi:glycosyltransferase involved in cell wall biosynthesis